MYTVFLGDFGDVLGRHGIPKSSGGCSNQGLCQIACNGLGFSGLEFRV